MIGTRESLQINGGKRTDSAEHPETGHYRRPQGFVYHSLRNATTLPVPTRLPPDTSGRDSPWDKQQFERTLPRSLSRDCLQHKKSRARSLVVTRNANPQNRRSITRSTPSLLFIPIEMGCENAFFSKNTGMAEIPGFYGVHFSSSDGKHPKTPLWSLHSRTTVKIRITI